MTLQTRARIETVTACVTGLLTLLTLVVPDWIEEVFSVDPDGGDGSLEWIIVLVLALVTAAIGRLAWRDRAQLAAS